MGTSDGMDLLENMREDIIDTLFKERCIECGGFLFLPQMEKVDEHLARGIVSCPVCEIELKWQFHFEEASH